MCGCKNVQYYSTYAIYLCEPCEYNGDGVPIFLVLKNACEEAGLTVPLK